MRFVALMVVVAIIYVVWTYRGPATSTDEAMKEADAVTQPVAASPAAASPVAPAPTSSGLRRPIDRTRAVLDQVRKRNGS